MKAIEFRSPIRFVAALPLLLVLARGQQAPTIDAPAFNPPGKLALTLHGEVGTNYAIEVSRDLHYWLPLTSGTATNGQMNFQYAPGSNTRALYYRGRLNIPSPPIQLSLTTDTNDWSITLITQDDGGSLSLTDTNGIIYTLTVPPQAVTDSRILTMTVVTSLGGLPFASGMLGGVVIEPSDVRFAQPAQLVIQFPTNRVIDPDQVIGYAFEDDGSYLRLVPDLVGSNSVTLLALESSGLGCSAATLDEILQQNQRIVADTNTAPSPGIVMRGAFYDSCYPAEKTRAVFVNKGIENALRPIQQEMAVKIAAGRQMQLLGVPDESSDNDLDLAGTADQFYNDNIAQYNDEMKTNCALASAILPYILGMERQAQLLGVETSFSSPLQDFCSLLQGCGQKIDDCCKTKGASQAALVEVLGLTRQGQLLGCDVSSLEQALQDCFPGWSGTVTYQDTYSNYQSFSDGGGEADQQYQLTATFTATNLVGQPTGQGYYGITGTINGTAEGKHREHTIQYFQDCCGSYSDNVIQSAVVTNVSALFQLVWSITNTPPGPPQNGLLLAADASSIAALGSVQSHLTDTESHCAVENDSCYKVYSVTSGTGTHSYALFQTFLNSPTITGTLDKVAGTYATNWTSSDGTQYTRKISWDIKRTPL